MSTTLDRILNTAADNLTVAKVLVQMGLDPNNVTYDAIFNRLLEIVLANINLANMFALFGAIFFVATLLTQTMVPLRVANMAGCAFFAAFGALAGDVKTLLLYLLLLPINAVRRLSGVRKPSSPIRRPGGSSTPISLTRNFPVTVRSISWAASPFFIKILPLRYLRSVMNGLSHSIEVSPWVAPRAFLTRTSI